MKSKKERRNFFPEKKIILGRQNSPPPPRLGPLMTREVARYQSDLLEKTRLSLAKVYSMRDRVTTRTENESGLWTLLLEKLNKAEVGFPNLPPPPGGGAPDPPDNNPGPEDPRSPLQPPPPQPFNYISQPSTQTFQSSETGCLLISSAQTYRYIWPA